MFDYQAGEKYKLTLIMVGVAGLMAGMFFSFLLMPHPDPQMAAGRRRPVKAYMMHPDVTGVARLPAEYGAGAANAAMPGAAQEPPMYADPFQCRLFVEQWLPLAWDLSAGTARYSQERAMAAMTADCARAYRQNVWTDALAGQIREAGLQSTFQTASIEPGPVQSDGSVVVTVTGVQKLGVPGNSERARQVKMQYLVKQTPDGMKIAGISEAGS